MSDSMYGAYPSEQAMLDDARARRVNGASVDGRIALISKNRLDVILAHFGDILRALEEAAPTQALACQVNRVMGADGPTGGYEFHFTIFGRGEPASIEPRCDCMIDCGEIVRDAATEFRCLRPRGHSGPHNG